jgi:hypothetical protein
MGKGKMYQIWGEQAGTPGKKGTSLFIVAPCRFDVMPCQH